MPTRSLTVTSKDGKNTMTADINVDLEYSDEEWAAFQQAVQTGIDSSAFTMSLSRDNWIVKPNPLYPMTLGGVAIRSEYSIPVSDSGAGVLSLDGICRILYNAGEIQQHAYSKASVPAGDTLQSALDANASGASAGLSKKLVDVTIPSIETYKEEQSSKHSGQTTQSVKFELPPEIVLKLMPQNASAAAFQPLIYKNDPNRRGSVVSSTDSSSNDGANAAAAPAAKSRNPFAGCFSACFGWLSPKSQPTLADLVKGSNTVATKEGIKQAGNTEEQQVVVGAPDLPTADGRSTKDRTGQP